ncbi:MAG: hypothetical protein CM15mP47_4090 [Methanobacteriota archaeon]|nr:MAG: hypothetical protein CM15mP47_4090 [Euryarchaeota archaeon]
MTQKQINEVLNMRGWGPQLLDKIMYEVNKVLNKSKKSIAKRRHDDIPLDSERETDY